MLEPLILGPTRPAAAARGFTMIEMMVVVVLAAVLLAVAAPSFLSTLARKRLEGVAAELSTDIQYARSEAVQRNRAVGIVFGSNCYVVYVVGATDATSCSTLNSPLSPLKAPPALPAGVSLNLVPAAPRAFVAFEPVRGMATDASGATELSGYVDIASSSGPWQIRAVVTRAGKVKLCSPNNSVTALATDCS